MQKRKTEKINPRLISSVYGKIAFKEKLHLFIRLKTVPWKKFFDIDFKPGNLLDYGCGHGLFLAIFKQFYPQYQLYGTDHDKRKIKIVEQYLGDVEIIDGIMASNKYHNYFDNIVICDVLYCNNYHEQLEILSLLHLCLKPGGRLLVKEIVSIPRAKYYYTLFQEIVVLRILKITKGNTIVLPHPDYYTRLLKAAGFDNVTDQPAHHGYIYTHHMFYGSKRA